MPRKLYRKPKRKKPFRRLVTFEKVEGFIRQNETCQFTFESVSHPELGTILIHSHPPHDLLMHQQVRAS